jgi:tetratricopeptide (TPR) repeat protein
MCKRLFLLLYLSLVLLFVFCVVSCSHSEEKAGELFKEGSQFFYQGNYDKAIKKYKKGLKNEPSNAIGYNLLGMAYRFRFNETGSQGYKDKEIDAFKKAIEIDPVLWVAYKNLAVSLYYQGRKKEAVPYLKKALQLQPNDPEKGLMLKWIEQGKGK